MKMERNNTLPVQRMIRETKYNDILKSQYSLQRASLSLGRVSTGKAF